MAYPILESLFKAGLKTTYCDFFAAKQKSLQFSAVLKKQLQVCFH
jgi:hypothetical protein